MSGTILGKNHCDSILDHLSVEVRGHTNKSWDEFLCIGEEYVIEGNDKVNMMQKYMLYPKYFIQGICNGDSGGPYVVKKDGR